MFFETVASNRSFCEHVCSIIRLFHLFVVIPTNTGLMYHKYELTHNYGGIIIACKLKSEFKSPDAYYRRERILINDT